jgi:hypothetical protein
MASLDNFIEQNIYVKGKPFTFSGRGYLRPVYTTQHRNLIVKFARQCEKSTMLANKMVCYQTALGPFNAMYVGPTQEQAANFSRNRYGPALKDSQTLNDAFFTNSKRKSDKEYDVVDQVFNKRLNNGSETYFRYAFHDAERCRGYSADGITIDEFQDIMLDHLPVIEEAMSHSPFKVRIYSGTPKSLENGMEQIWRQSTQNCWCVQCTHCDKWQRLGIHNIGLTGPSCKSCARNLHIANGQWVQFNKGAMWEGFHVSHIMVPWVDWGEILHKRDTYSEGKFMNEVMGESWDLLDKVLSEQDMRRCCDEKRGMFELPPDRYAISASPMPMFAGVDWGKGEGKGYTILTIGSPVIGNPNMIAVWYMKKYQGHEADPLFQIQDIAERCMKFNVQVIGADHGFGFTNNKLLRKAVGENKVFEYQSVHSTQGGVLKYDGATDRYSMNRTKACADLILRIKAGNLSFPNWASFKPFSNDFTGIYEDYSEKARMFYYDHSPDNPDDAFFATLYLTQAIKCFGDVSIKA